VGDPVALAAFARAGRAVGVALASVATLLELDCIAVGGGLGLAGAIVVEPMREAFLDHAAMEYVARCRIVPAALDRGAGVVGAATLAMPLGYWSPAGAD
jgi:glucokinase